MLNASMLNPAPYTLLLPGADEASDGGPPDPPDPPAAGPPAVFNSQASDSNLICLISATTPHLLPKIVYFATLCFSNSAASFVATSYPNFRAFGNAYTIASSSK